MANLTNAERQKRYRDRKRGCPPQGRWHGYLPVSERAKMLVVSRTMIFMASWIRRHAPDVSDQLMAGELKTTPTYKRLKAEYNAGLLAAVESRKRTEGYRLVSFRKDGKFVFKWVKSK